MKWFTKSSRCSLTVCHKCQEQHPFIELTAKLTRSYASYIVIMLLIISYHFFNAANEIQDSGELTKMKIIQSCHKAEGAAVMLMNAPETAVLLAKKSAIRTADLIIKQTGELLASAVHILNLILLFVLHRYTKLILCILETIIAGTVGAVANHAAEIRDFINNQISKIEGALSNGLNDINEKVSALLGAGANAANKISTVLGGKHVDPPKFSLPDVSSNLHFEIPAKFVTALQDLKTKVPSMDEIEKTVSDVISSPFKLLEDKIKGKFNGINMSSSMNFGANRVLQKSQVNFCNGGKLDLSWVDEFVSVLTKAMHIIGGILIALSIVYIIFNIFKIKYLHKRQQKAIESLSDVLLDEQYLKSRFAGPFAHVPRHSCEKLVLSHEVRDLTMNPILFKITKKISGLTGKCKQKQNRFRWWLDYVSHRPSLMCLMIGLLGLSVLTIQIAVIETVSASVIPSLIEKAEKTSVILIKDMANEINEIAGPYAKLVSNDISNLETKTNDVLFGWLDDAIVTLNSSINKISTGFNSKISNVFDPVPPLRDAILTFVNCTIGVRIENIQDVLTFIKDKIKVKLPKVDPDFFMVDEAQIQKILSPHFKSSSDSNSNTVKDASSSSPKTKSIGDHLNVFLETYKKRLNSQYGQFIILTIFGASVFLVSFLVVLYWILIPQPHCKRKKNFKLNHDNESNSSSHFNFDHPYESTSKLSF